MFARKMYRRGDFVTATLFDRLQSRILLSSLITIATLALWDCSPGNSPVPFADSLSPIQRPISGGLSPGLTFPVSPLPSPTTPLITAPPESCLSSPGQLVKGVIDTALLKPSMTYTVYLPPCYDREPGRHYPVLYLLHGQGNHEDQWLRLGVPATADKLIAASEAPPFIIVFPYDYSHQQPPDYHFEDVLVQLLVPHIDLTFRTLPDPAHRAVGGLSRGGAWALHLGIHHPDVFGIIGAHSPAIFYVDYNSLPRILLDIPSEKLPRIFIDIGDADGGKKVVEPFETFLAAHTIPHEWHQYVGDHEGKYWSAHVEEYLRWYAQDWR